MRRCAPAVYGGLLLGTMVAGAAVRFVPMGLPAGVVKFGGSGMWAVCFYWLFRMAGIRLGWAAVGAGVVTSAVEWFKLYRSPGMDAFRGTRVGVLVLGRYFSWWDLGAYWVGIGVAAGVDGAWVRRCFGDG